MNKFLLGFAERWWIFLIGCEIVGIGTMMMFVPEFRATQGYIDKTQSWHGGASVMGLGFFIMIVWSLPPIARWRRALFGMQNLPLHNRLTLALGVFGPVVGLVLFGNIVLVVLLDLPQRYMAIKSPTAMLVATFAGIEMHFLLFVTCFTRECELKRRREQNCCELCGYGLVEESRLCSECGIEWPVRKKSLWMA
jgi:hypothetical protein